MSADRDRDAVMARLIESALRRPAADLSPSSSLECLEAEMLAAFVERRLAPEEVRQVEGHLSGCERCQETLAALVRTLPGLRPRPEPRVGWMSWLSPPWRWAVPATAVAALFAAWVVGRTPVRAPAEPEATVAEALPPASGVAPELAGKDAPAREDALAARPEVLAVPEGIRTVSPAGEATAGAPQKTAEAPAAAASEAARTDTVAASPAPPVPAAAPADAAAIVAERLQVDEARSAEAKRVPAAPLPTQRAQETGRRALAPRASEIASPDGTARWRFGFGGMLFRSSDGMTWEKQETGTTLDLLSGSAPSASVCWVVGRGGLVLLTADGEHWRRVPFPETVDLVRVAASDVEYAVVTASDDRRFETTDGGQTWTQVP